MRTTEEEIFHIIVLGFLRVAPHDTLLEMNYPD